VSYPCDTIRLADRVRIREIPSQHPGLGELPGFQVIDSPHQPRTLAAFAAKCRSQGKIHDRYRHVLIASATGYSSHCLMSSCNDITG
jgi:hypothetical protein